MSAAILERSNQSGDFMTESKITIWGAVTPRALRVHWALEELGLDYKAEPIQIGRAHV